jgi:hypothetical protein
MIRLAGEFQVRFAPFRFRCVTYCTVFVSYITILYSGRISTAERSSHTGVFLTIQLTEAQNQYPVDAEVLRLNGPYYMFEQLLFCIYSSAITFLTTYPCGMRHLKREYIL